VGSQEPNIEGKPQDFKIMNTT